MKKKNIRKYILEALAGLLVIGACLTVNELSRKEAYADDAKDMGEISDVSNGLTIDEICSKLDEKGSFTEMIDGVEKTVTIEWDSGSLSGYKRFSQTEDIEVTGAVSYPGGVTGQYTSAKINVKFTSASIDFTIDDISKENSLSQTDIIKSFPETVNVIVDENKHTGEVTNWTGFPGGTPYVQYDTIGDYTLYGTVKVDGCTLPSEAICTLTITQTPILKWNVTVPVNEISVDGTAVNDKGINSITYDVLNGSNVVKTFTKTFSSSVKAGSNLVLSDSIKSGIVNGGNYTISLKSCIIDGDSNNYTVSGTSSAAAFTDGIGNISGNLSGISVAATTSPANYSSIAKGAFVSSGDDHSDLNLSLEDMTEALTKSILQYAYEHGDATFKTNINNIIKEKHQLTLKLVAKEVSKSKVGSSIADKLEDKAQDYGDDSKNAKLGNYFDISVYAYDATAGGDVSDSLRISKTGKALSFKYKIPNDVKSSSSSSSSNGSSKRYYNVVRYHDGAHGVGLDYSTDTTLEFDVDEFSYFSTAYYDKSSSSSSSTSASSSKSNSASVPGQGDDAAAGGTDKSKTPKTGDDFNPRIWIYLLIVCATVASAAWILLQDTREDNEKKQK